MKDINILKNNGINVDQALGLFGTMDKYDNVLDVFYTTIQDKLTQLTNAKTISDTAQYRLLVHALKSEAGYFGFEVFHNQAYQHEIAAKNNDTNFIDTHFEELMTEIKRIVSVVGQYMGKEAVQTATAPVVSVPETPVTPNPVANKKIIVIDEDNTIPHLIHQVFANQFDISLVNNGVEAINLLDNNVIGLIINLQMQTVNALSILDVIKDHQLFSTMPICVALEGHIEIPRLPTVNVDILRKPFHERDIKEKVEKFLIFNQ